MLESHRSDEEASKFPSVAEAPEECLDDRPPAVSAVNPGKALRLARETRSLTIADLNRTTKIGVPVLTALEEGNVARLPATIFTRGFLKAYAKEVGLDPDETADMYLAQLAPLTLAVDGANARLKVARPAYRTEVMAYDEDTSKFLADRQVGRVGWLMTAVAAVGLVVYVWSFAWSDRAAREEVAVTPPAATDVAPASGTAAPSAAADAAPAMVETPIGPLQFQLKPSGPCWLAAAADGNPVFARLLDAGDEETIEVHDELVLRVGDPAALSYWINGQPGRRLGEPREPVNVRITKENFREFLGV
jgi:hypothetical protein